MWTRAPVSRQSSIINAIAASSASRGASVGTYRICEDQIATEASRGVDRPFKLGMYKQNRIEAGELRHSDPQVGFSHMRKFVDSGVDQEAFESAYTLS